MGMPVTNAFRGNDVDIPAAVRRHVMGMYADGTATDGGSAMQTILPAVANQSLPVPEKGMVSSLEDAALAVKASLGKLAAHEAALFTARPAEGVLQNAFDLTKPVANFLPQLGMLATSYIGQLAGVDPSARTQAIEADPIGYFGKTIGNRFLSGEPTPAQAAIQASLEKAEKNIGIDANYEPPTTAGKITKTVADLSPYSLGGGMC